MDTPMVTIDKLNPANENTVDRLLLVLLLGSVATPSTAPDVAAVSQAEVGPHPPLDAGLEPSPSTPHPLTVVAP